MVTLGKVLSLVTRRCYKGENLTFMGLSIAGKCICDNSGP